MNDISTMMRAYDFQDDPFHRLIADLPESLLGVSGSDIPAVAQLPLFREPHRLLNEIHHACGPVIEVIDGKLGGYVLPDLIGFPPGRRIFAVSGWDAAVEMVKTGPDKLSSEGGLVALEAVFGSVLSMVEGDRHKLLRQSFNDSAFNAKRIEARADELMQPTAEYLVDRLKWKIGRGEAGDVMRDLGLPMVYRPLSRIIGVPEEDFGRFVYLVEKSMAGQYDMDAAVQSVREIDAFFRDLMAKRREAPEDDIISRLIMQDNPNLKLSEKDMVANTTFLLPAGLDTTRHQTTAMLAALMKYPDQYRLVTESPDDRVVFAVDECMRFLPSAVVGSFRHAKSDTEIAGTTIPAGSHAFLLIASINRDPTHWGKPDTFDVTRSPGMHFGFSAGRHVCIGQSLARRSMQTLLNVLARELPGLRSVHDPATILLSGMPQSGPAGGLAITADL